MFWRTNPRPRRDLTGQRFGKWSVISFAGPSRPPNDWGSTWNCVCDCGTRRVVRGSQLVSKQTGSCGCVRRRAPLGLVGQTFGLLTVIAPAEPGPHGQQRWRVRCACGNELVVRRQGIVLGRQTSCGCGPRVGAAGPVKYRWTRGVDKATRRAWRTVLMRCYFEHGTGEGPAPVKICDCWTSLAGFVDDMGPAPGAGYKIIRHDLTADFTKDNTAWAPQDTPVAYPPRHRLDAGDEDDDDFDVDDDDDFGG